MLRRSITFSFAFSMLLISLPVLVAKIPPILDYPNHVVRMWLLSGGVTIAPVSTMYKIVWANASTNIGIDIVASALGGVISSTIISGFVLFFALALPPLGAACLHRQVFGGAHWWQIGIVLLAWNEVTLRGLLNFEVALGLALMGAVADASMVAIGAITACAGRMLLGAAILLVHPFGLFFYAILIGALALGPQFAPLTHLNELGRRIGQAVLDCLPIVASLIGFLVLAPHLPGEQVGAAAWDVVWQSHWVLGHLLMMLIPVRTYDLKLDLGFLALLLLPIVISTILGRIRFHAGLLLAAVALFVLSNFMPTRVAGTAAIEVRVPCMAALTLAAALRPDISASILWNRIALAAMLMLATARTLWITDIWVARQADVAAVERALSYVPSGSALLSMENKPDKQQLSRAPLGRFIEQGQPVFWHLPVLAIMERHAFVPTLFTALGKQPVAVLPPWNQIAVAEGILPPVDLLNGSANDGRFPYLDHWRDRFDYLLVVNADMANAKGPLPSLYELHLMADEGFARLYRISNAK